MLNYSEVGVMAFCSIMNVINLKLQLELNNKSASAMCISIISLGLFYTALYVLSDQKLSIQLKDDLAGTLPEHLMNIRSVIVVLTTTVLVLTPELISNIVREVQLHESLI